MANPIPDSLSFVDLALAYSGQTFLLDESSSFDAPRLQTGQHQESTRRVSSPIYPLARKVDLTLSDLFNLSQSTIHQLSHTSVRSMEQLQSCQEKSLVQQESYQGKHKELGGSTHQLIRKIDEMTLDFSEPELHQPAKMSVSQFLEKAWEADQLMNQVDKMNEAKAVATVNHVLTFPVTKAIELSITGLQHLSEKNDSIKAICQKMGSVYLSIKASVPSALKDKMKDFAQGWREANQKEAAFLQQHLGIPIELTRQYKEDCLDNLLALSMQGVARVSLRILFKDTSLSFFKSERFYITELKEKAISIKEKLKSNFESLFEFKSNNAKYPIEKLKGIISLSDRVNGFNPQLHHLSRVSFTQEHIYPIEHSISELSGFLFLNKDVFLIHVKKLESLDNINFFKMIAKTQELALNNRAKKLHLRAAFTYESERLESVLSKRYQVVDERHVVSLSETVNNYGFVEKTFDIPLPLNQQVCKEITWTQNLAKDYFINPKDFKGTLSKDLVVVQYHGVDAQSNYKWWQPVYQANQQFKVEDMMNQLAILREWGERTHVSIARIPAGSYIEMTHGRARSQVSLNESRPGNGVQYYFHDFDPDWIRATRSLPVSKSFE